MPCHAADIFSTIHRHKLLSAVTSTVMNLMTVKRFTDQAPWLKAFVPPKVEGSFNVAQHVALSALLNDGNMQVTWPLLYMTEFCCLMHRQQSQS